MAVTGWVGVFYSNLRTNPEAIYISRIWQQGVLSVSFPIFSFVLFGYSLLRSCAFSALALFEFYFGFLPVCLRQTHGIGTWPPAAMTKVIIRVKILKSWQYLLDRILINCRSLKQCFYLLFVSYGFWVSYPFPKTLYPHLTFSLTSCDLGNGLKGKVIARRVPKIQTGETIWSNHHSLKLRSSL